jgi:hypothetical protein
LSHEVNEQSEPVVVGKGFEQKIDRLVFYEKHLEDHNGFDLLVEA